MDDKVLKEIKFHQQIIGPERSSPLHLIREKEMEISGRLFATRKRAEEMIAEARKRAIEVKRNADIEGQRMAEEHARAVLEEVEREVSAIEAKSIAEAEVLKERVADRMDDAVDFVVKVLTKA